MTNINKFYKGSVESFKQWLIALSKDETEEGSKKYIDIKNSIVYISENYDKLPDDLDRFEGAIYAHGAIIGGVITWNNESNIRFYRLGQEEPIEYSVYQKYQVEGNIIFARVAEQNGAWDSSDSILVSPAYYIWANGIEYKVANEDALEYVLSAIKILKSDETTEGSIAKSIKDALNAYKPKAKDIAELVTSDSNVQVDVVDSSLKLRVHSKIEVGSTLPESGIHGDFFIVEKQLYNSSIPQRTAYIWNSSLGESGAWQALDGNVNAENVYFPEGINHTQAWGTVKESEEVLTSGKGKNLKDLMELFLVEEKYPTVTTVVGTANASTYKILLNVPDALSKYMSSTSTLVEVGSIYTFNGVSLSEQATHDGKLSYTGTDSTITGMKYGSANSIEGPVISTETSKIATATTATMKYTDNFSEASATITIDNNAGFNGINKESNTVTGLDTNKTLILNTQSGTTLEGTNILSLSWSNTASISREFIDHSDIEAIDTVYYASNKGNLSVDKKTSTPTVQWKDLGKDGTKVTYNSTKLTVTAVYPIYTNGGRIQDKPYSKPEGSFASSPQKLGIWDYTTKSSLVKYIGFGSTSNGDREIYFPISSKHTFKISSAYGYNTTSGKYDETNIWFETDEIKTIDNKDFKIWRCNTTGLGQNDVQITIEKIS